MALLFVQKFNRFAPISIFAQYPKRNSAKTTINNKKVKFHGGVAAKYLVSSCVVLCRLVLASIMVDLISEIRLDVALRHASASRCLSADVKLREESRNANMSAPRHAPCRVRCRFRL